MKNPPSRFDRNFKNSTNITKLFLFITPLFFISSLLAAEPIPFEENFSFDLAQQQLHNDPDSLAYITVNNRILAKVNGNPISVIDVMKKMDLVFHQQFPSLTDSELARFQFYTTNWTYFLKDMIDNELILADAQAKKIPITPADVREEMEALFGPNVVLTIDKMGLSYEDVWKMLEKDISVRRMFYFMVRTKAMDKVHPKDMRLAYEDFTKKHQKPNEWFYHVISIRGTDSDKNADIAQAAYELLKNETDIDFKILTFRLNEIDTFDDLVNISISEEFHRTDNTIAKSHKEVLSDLQTGQFGKPIQQISRADNTTVYRIFYLNQHLQSTPVTFNEIEEQLKEELLARALSEESDIYLNKLRHRFGFDDNSLKDTIPENFQPFTMQ